jgi:hypothetical protein
MGKNWKNEIAEENYKTYRENARYRVSWERDANIFENARYNVHFSPSEEADMLALNLAPVPVSLLTAICDSADAMMVASRPTVHVAPIINPYDDQFTEISKAVAQKYNFLIKRSWYDSLGSLQYDRVVRDSGNVGHGIFYVVPRITYGEFNVDIKHINWRYFFPHPSSTDMFYRDMDNAVIAMRISPKAAYRIVRNFEDDITFDKFKKDWGKHYTLTGNSRVSKYDPALKDSILFTHRLQLEDQMVYIVNPKKDNVNYNGEIPFKTYTEYTPELKEQERRGDIEIIKEMRFVLTEYTSVGGLGYKVVYPISQPNFVPLVHDHRDTPYPIGRVWYLYPLQRALNKFVMTAILNGTMMNSTRIVSEEGSIVNKDEWKKNFTKMGAMLEYKPLIPGQSKPPVIIEGKPLSDAWLQFPRQIMYWMEYVSGQFGTMMGDPSQAPDVFSTLASLQSSGGQRVRKRLMVADGALSIVGQIVGEFYKNYAPPNGFATTINEDGTQSAPEKYNILVPNNKVKQDGSSEVEIKIRPDTDLSIGFNKVRFVTQGSTGFEAGTEAALLTTLATQLKVSELIPLILTRLNMKDVDKIIKNIDVKNQLQMTVQQQGEIIKELEGRTKILQNQIVQKGMEVDVAKFGAELKKVLNDIKSQAENQ